MFASVLKVATSAPARVELEDAFTPALPPQPAPASSRDTHLVQQQPHQHAVVEAQQARAVAVAHVPQAVGGELGLFLEDFRGTESRSNGHATMASSVTVSAR